MVDPKPVEEVEWAEVGTPAAPGSNPPEAPTSGRRGTGYGFQEILPHEIFNYLLRAVGRWIRWLESKVDNHVHDGGTDPGSVAKIDIEDHIALSHPDNPFFSQGDVDGYYELSLDSGKWAHFRATGRLVAERGLIGNSVVPYTASGGDPTTAVLAVGADGRLYNEGVTDFELNVGGDIVVTQQPGPGGDDGNIFCEGLVRAGSSLQTGSIGAITNYDTYSLTLPSAVNPYTDYNVMRSDALFVNYIVKGNITAQGSGPIGGMAKAKNTPRVILNVDELGNEEVISDDGSFIAVSRVDVGRYRIQLDTNILDLSNCSAQVSCRAKSTTPQGAYWDIISKSEIDVFTWSKNLADELVPNYEPFSIVIYGRF